MSEYRSVVVIQEHVPHYREPFFQLLRQILNSTGVELRLVGGTQVGSNLLPSVLPWEHRVPVHRTFGLTYQRASKHIRKGDLVIVEQASKHLLNYALACQHACGRVKLCFWGHGRNLQSSTPNSPSEIVKRWMSRRVHWWFAYNDLSARVVEALGYPGDRITSVQNAIDTRLLQDAKATVTEETRRRTLAELRFSGCNVCVYTGGMYKEKRIHFLLEACMCIRRAVPDFEMIFIGSGPDEHLVKAAAQTYSWIRFLGPLRDREKVPYWAVSKLLLMPGLVGLVVLDSFALGIPMVTTAVPYHSPEIDYLHDGVNGLKLEQTDSVASYANAVVALLRDEPRRDRLAQAGRVAASTYTIEEMARRFAYGVLKAIEV